MRDCGTPGRQLFKRDGPRRGLFGGVPVGVALDRHWSSRSAPRCVYPHRTAGERARAYTRASRNDLPRSKGAYRDLRCVNSEVHLHTAHETRTGRYRGPRPARDRFQPLHRRILYRLHPPSHYDLSLARSPRICCRQKRASALPHTRPGSSLTSYGS